jgi:hypothetical protein
LKGELHGDAHPVLRAAGQGEYRSYAADCRRAGEGIGHHPGCAGNHRIFAGTGIKVIAVTISAAYSPEGWSISAEERQALEAKGITVLTCGNGLTGGVNDALSDSVPAKIVCKTLYTFGQGMKVAVEVSLMAADAGLLEMDKEAIAIAGSDEGADTAIVITPVYARNFPQLRVHEILAKTR